MINIKFNYNKIIMYIVLIMNFIFAACTPSEKFLMRQHHDTRLSKNLIRVLILKTNNLVTINSDGKITIKDKFTNELKYSGENKNIKIRPEKIKDAIIIEASNKIVIINNIAYRGSLEIKNINGILNAVNIIPMEEYLYSVVPGEIPAVWPDEALKAQAIAARTYAMHHILKQKIKNDFDLDATTNFQVYKGISTEDERTTVAVKMTQGEILVFNNKPIISYFHSTCGGRTADDRFVWQDNDLKYLNEVQCKYCKDSPSYSWETEISIKQIEQYMNKSYPEVKRIKNISFKKRSGRVFSVIIKHDKGTLELTGNQFRLLFPGKTLLSLYFKTTKSSNGLKIIGNGWGHGVGLCQYGAKGMADKGINYKRILKHYYKGVSLSKIRNIDKRYIAGY